MNNIQDLLNKLKIKTNIVRLYEEALTHNSYINENKNIKNYQRLEFLGDAILSKITSCYLFYEGFNEKEMTENRQSLVRSETLIKASEELDLINYAFLGKGINLEKDTKKIKEDIFESLIGAVYLDKGELKVYEILKKTIFRYFEENLIDKNFDYKTRVQELLQSKSSKTNKQTGINYISKQSSDKTFFCELFYKNILYGKGIGKTKKEAEQSAAKDAWKKYSQ